MKKLISIILASLLVCVCFSVVISAAETYTDPISLLPETKGPGKMTATGCTVVENKNGSVTITLTAAAGTVKMAYKEGATILDEKYTKIDTNQRVAYYYAKTKGISSFEAQAHYCRSDKGDVGADLFLSAMHSTGAYLEKGTATGDFGVWNIYNYLKDKKNDAKYLPTDGILKFYDITYTIGGAIGDSVTLYNYDVVAAVDDNFGTEIPSDVPESSAPVIDTSSKAPATSSKPESSKPTPGTSDNGLVAFAVIAAVAVAAAVVVKKVR